MKLTVKDRILLGGILPARSSLSKMKAKAGIKSKIEFSDQEEKDIKMKVIRLQVKWNGINLKLRKLK